MKYISHLLALLASLFVLAACEQPVMLGDETVGTGKAVVRVNLHTIDFLPFDTRSVQSLAEATTRFSYCLFSLDGTRLANTKSLTNTDAGYGSLTLKLEPGTYILVTVGHNGAGNCTISSPTKVTFQNNKMTDTFASCDTLVVKEGEQSADIVMQRCVAMVRLVLDEPVANDIKQLRFEYTGGSSTLDPSTGFGNVNSNQKETRDVPASAHTSAGSAYDIYTIPHSMSDELKINITALDGEGSELMQKVLTAVPVERGYISRVHCSLKGSNNSLNVTLGNTDWQIRDYNY